MNNTPTNFKAKTKEVNGCWEWTGPTDKDGYGKTTIKCKPTRAHRASYELYVGEIPDGLVLDHLCRNKICVNPAHLEPVTQRENQIRGMKSKTHCINGHLYNDIYVNCRGQRNCRKCLTINAARYREKRFAVAT